MKKKKKINHDFLFFLLKKTVDTTSVSVRTFQYNGADGSSIFPGKNLVKIAGAQPFRVSAYEESYIVSAIKGWDYYVILANGQDTLLYGIDLQTGEIFINGYSPVCFFFFFSK